MFNSLRLGCALLAAFAVALCLPGLSFAEDRDTQEVLSYKLTDAGLAKYTQATRKLAALPGGMAGACDDEEESDSQSLDHIVSKLNAQPGAQAAIQSAGMTTREYVVFSWSILQNGLAAWALSQPGGELPAGASQANVDFYKKNEAKLAELGELTEGRDCGEEPVEEESEDG